MKVLEMVRFVLPANLSGLPAACVPVGFAEDLPTGVQVIGDIFREDLCLERGRGDRAEPRGPHADRSSLNRGASRSPIERDDSPRRRWSSKAVRYSGGVEDEHECSGTGTRSKRPVGVAVTCSSPSRRRSGGRLPGHGLSPLPTHRGLVRGTRERARAQRYAGPRQWGRSCSPAAEELARREGCYRMQLTSRNVRIDAHRFYEGESYTRRRVRALRNCCRGRGPRVIPVSTSKTNLESRRHSRRGSRAGYDGEADVLLHVANARDERVAPPATRSRFPLAGLSRRKRLQPTARVVDHHDRSRAQ